MSKYLLQWPMSAGMYIVGLHAGQMVSIALGYMPDSVPPSLATLIPGGVMAAAAVAFISKAVAVSRDSIRWLLLLFYALSMHVAVPILSPLSLLPSAAQRSIFSVVSLLGAATLSSGFTVAFFQPSSLFLKESDAQVNPFSRLTKLVRRVGVVFALLASVVYLLVTVVDDALVRSVAAPELLEVLNLSSSLSSSSILSTLLFWARAWLSSALFSVAIAAVLANWRISDTRGFVLIATASVTSFQALVFLATTSRVKSFGHSIACVALIFASRLAAVAALTWLLGGAKCRPLPDTTTAVETKKKTK
jgi:hypothetical protein